jgi:hypothetical protein
MVAHLGPIALLSPIVVEPVRGSHSASHPWRLEMSEQTQSVKISRRTAFSLLASLGVAAPVTILAVANAEAQTPGMERRQDRRDNRQDRREDRRDNRQDRRDNRQTRRNDRRGTTVGTGSQPK